MLLLIYCCELHGFKNVASGFASNCMGFKGYHFKTRANRSIRMYKLIRPVQIAASYVESMAGPCQSKSPSCKSHGFQWDSARIC